MSNQFSESPHKNCALQSNQSKLEQLMQLLLSEHLARWAAFLVDTRSHYNIYYSNVNKVCCSSFYC